MSLWNTSFSFPLSTRKKFLVWVSQQVALVTNTFKMVRVCACVCLCLCLCVCLCLCACVCVCVCVYVFFFTACRQSCSEASHPSAMNAWVIAFLRHEETSLSASYVWLILRLGSCSFLLRISSHPVYGNRSAGKILTSAHCGYGDFQIPKVFVCVFFQRRCSEGIQNL